MFKPMKQLFIFSNSLLTLLLGWIICASLFHLTFIVSANFPEVFIIKQLAIVSCFLLGVFVAVICSHRLEYFLQKYLNQNAKHKQHIEKN
jgi:hypothetical protein